MATVDAGMVTSGLELPGFRVVRNFGIVRGIIVRSRSVVGSFGAGIQQLFGGNISLYTELCERAREDAYLLMIQHAAQIGANGILSVTARELRTDLEQTIEVKPSYGLDDVTVERMLLDAGDARRPDY